MAGVPFVVNAVFMSLLIFNVCVPLKADPLNCTFPQTQKALGPLYQPHLPHTASAGWEGTIQEVQKS